VNGVEELIDHRPGQSFPKSSKLTVTQPSLSSCYLKTRLLVLL